LRRGIVAISAALLVVIGVAVLAVRESGDEATPPPDEDAYVEELFTSKFDVLLPKRPFIDEGYAACELLRAGHTEEQTAFVLWSRDDSTGGVQEEVRERYRRQTAAAHRHLCPSA